MYIRTTTCLESIGLTLLSSQYIHPPLEAIDAVSNHVCKKKMKIVGTSAYNDHYLNSQNDWSHRIGHNDRVGAGSGDHLVTLEVPHSAETYQHLEVKEVAYNW